MNAQLRGRGKTENWDSPLIFTSTLLFGTGAVSHQLITGVHQGSVLNPIKYDIIPNKMGMIQHVFLRYNDIIVRSALANVKGVT